jgi:hypothetical protein
MRTGPTIEQLATALLTEIAPDKVDLLPVVVTGFYRHPAVRRRMVRAVRRPRRGPVVAGVDPGAVDLVVQTVIVLLNAIATDVISDAARQHGRGLAGWFRRRFRRDPLSRPATDGAATTLPAMSAAEAAAVGEAACRLAIAAGLSPDRAAAVRNKLAGDLTDLPTTGAGEGNRAAPPAP